MWLSVWCRGTTLIIIIYLSSKWMTGREIRMGVRMLSRVQEWNTYNYLEASRRFSDPATSFSTKTYLKTRQGWRMTEAFPISFPLHKVHYMPCASLIIINPFRCMISQVKLESLKLSILMSQWLLAKGHWKIYKYRFPKYVYLSVSHEYPS